LFWLRKNRKARRLNRKARRSRGPALQVRIIRGVITSARRIRIIARITTLPSNTASRNKFRLANNSAALAEDFFFVLILARKNGKRGAGRLPVFFVYALSSAEWA
jgi:hypothetical protein